MPPRNRLESVAQSTAHHAVSGLCYVNPHLSKACATIGASSCIIDLLAKDPCPLKFKEIEPIQLSIGALRDKFLKILNTEGFQIEDLLEATLVYEYPYSDDYSSNCSVKISSISGYTVTRAVDYVGHTAEIIHPDTEQDAAANP